MSDYRTKRLLRVAILGNAGSGKSTLARWLADRSGATVLDLDTVAWEPDEIAAARKPDAALRDVQAFCTRLEPWVVEGCYGSLVAATLPFRPTLIFVNPGLEACIANCRSRPWEPHKYPSREAQDERLAMLLAWVREYYARDDDMSLARHRALYAEYAGPKVELVEPPDLTTVEGLLAALAT